MRVVDPECAHRLAYRRTDSRPDRARPPRRGRAVRRPHRRIAEAGSGPPSRPDGLTSEQISILDADAVLARIIPGGSLEQLIYRVDALHWIENRGVRVVNSPRAIERSVDKFYTTTLLHDAGLLVPETVVCERVEDAMAAVRAMGDVVIKPIFGSLGHGMVRVSDPDTALRVVRALDQIRSVFYVQRAIDHGGRDLRIFVVGGRVIGAIERRAPAGEWRTNVAIGGSATAVDVSAGDRACRARVLPRLWVPTMPASMCCPRATARSTCSRSTASRDGRGCSRQRASTWRRPSSSIVERVRAARDAHPSSQRSLCRHERCLSRACRRRSWRSIEIIGR